MNEWLKRHPRLGDLLTGILVAAALLLLAANELRSKAEGASSGAYYSQF